MVDKLFFREESMVLRCSPKILPMLCPILNGHRPVRPTRLGPSGLAFYFYPLQLPSSPHLVRRFLCKGANWGDGQSNIDGSMFMGVTKRNICER